MQDTPVPSALAKFVESNIRRGEALVLDAIQAKRPIDVEQLIDLLQWARSAAGDVTMTSSGSDGQQTYSIERVPASSEPVLRLTGSIRYMVNLVNKLVASGTINVTAK